MSSYFEEKFAMQTIGQNKNKFSLLWLLLLIGFILSFYITLGIMNESPVSFGDIVFDLNTALLLFFVLLLSAFILRLPLIFFIWLGSALGVFATFFVFGWAKQGFSFL